MIFLLIFCLFFVDSTASRSSLYSWKVCDTGVRCYNLPFDIGCFENGPNTKFCQQMELPWGPADMNPSFKFYTPEHSEQEINIFMLFNSIEQLRFDQNKQLWVVVHGFGLGEKEWMSKMKNALINKGHNVLVCDWTIGAGGPDYFQAAANTRVIGATLALVIKTLSTDRGLDLSKTSIVGFSLGAHVAGFAGERLKTLGQIIGLDPAGPLFEYSNPEARLDHTDAQFVQVIHSNGDNLYKGGLGAMQAMGHVDFYPNGGRVQPGCQSGVELAFGELWKRNFTALHELFSCNHEFALDLFLHTIENNECKFVSFQCKNDNHWLTGNCFESTKKRCRNVGYMIDRREECTGKMFFTTRTEDQGLCGNQYLVQMHLATPVWGQIDISLGQNNTEFVPFLRQNNLVRDWVQTIISVPLTEPTSLSLHYISHKTWIFALGINSFNVDFVRIANIGGEVYQFSGFVEVVSNETLLIDITKLKVKETRYSFSDLFNSLNL